MAETNNMVFEDRFSVDAVDKEGKKFDRVARINGKSDKAGMDLTLDINSELYPLREGEIITLALARSLLADAEEDDIAESVNGDGEEGGSRRKVKRELWRGGDQGIAADFEYVMYGKTYKFDDSQKGDNMTTAYFSFGGLLMALRGSYRHLANVVVGENVYLLIRKSG